MSITVTITDPTGIPNSRRHGPIKIGAIERVRVVLARPVVLDQEEQRIELDPPAAPLLDGYRSTGATPPERAHLRAHVAAELVNRAGATLRRLEQGAIAKARFALQASTRLA